MSTVSNAREELARAAHAVASRGLSHGSTGNISCRVGDRVLVTPTRTSLATVQPDELAEVDLYGNALSEAVPSKEAGMHAAMYRARTEDRAVVHVHSCYATAVSCLADIDEVDALPALTAYYAMRVASLPVVEYAPPGDHRLAEWVGVASQKSSTILLRNHGLVVGAVDPPTAIDVAEEIEETARVYLALHGRDTTSLTPKQRRDLSAASAGQTRS